MTENELAKASNPVIRASLTALRKAAAMARQTAIQTNTGIIVVKNGKPVLISAKQLRSNQP